MVREESKFFNPTAYLTKAGIGRVICHYRQKETIFSQGERADALYYIQEGKLQLSVHSKRGKVAIIALLGSSDFLGVECIDSNQPLRLMSAIAITDCSVLRIEKGEMLRMLHGEQQFSDLFIANVVSRHNRVQSDLIDRLFNSSERRLARALLTLACFGQESKSETVLPNISQEMLSEMIGTTRSRVNFFMNRFRKLGFIDYDGCELRVHRSLRDVLLTE